MRLVGCVLLAGAGVWSGLLAARYVSEEVGRCGMWCRMLELMAFELERFRTPLPDLFASLSVQLDGVPRQVCEAVSTKVMAEPAELRAVWQGETGGLPLLEREILQPLGDVLGRFGAEEQSAALITARERMDALRQTRQNELRDKRKIRFGLCSAGGILLAVLLM